MNATGSVQLRQPNMARAKLNEVVAALPLQYIVRIAKTNQQVVDLLFIWALRV